MYSRQGKIMVVKKYRHLYWTSTWLALLKVRKTRIYKWQLSKLCFMTWEGTKKVSLLITDNEEIRLMVSLRINGGRRKIVVLIMSWERIGCWFRIVWELGRRIRSMWRSWRIRKFIDFMWIFLLFLSFIMAS